MNTVLQLADGVFTVGQSIGDVHGWIAKITNASMFSIQPEQGKGRKVTIFLSRERGLPPSMQPGMAIACGGLTFKGVYNGNSPQGAYTQNQFDAQFADSPTSQPGSPAGAASSAGRESEGERRDSIEAQAVMKASAVIIRGAYDGVLSKGGDMTGFKIMHDFDSVFDHLWTKLQTTKGKAQPAQPGQPGKPGGEGEGTFIEAQQVRAILMKMYNDDAVKAKAAFQAITGVDGLSACPDKACAEKWLTQARKIEASRNGLKRDDSKAAFLDTLIKPGLDMDERNSELENVVASDKLDDIPF